MKYKLEVLYDGTWVEDVTIEAGSKEDAYNAVLDQARDNIEVRGKENENV